MANDQAQNSNPNVALRESDAFNLYSSFYFLPTCLPIERVCLFFQINESNFCCDHWHVKSVLNESLQPQKWEITGGLQEGNYLKEIQKQESLLAMGNLMETSTFTYTGRCIKAQAEIDAQLSEVICHLRIKIPAIFRYLLLLPVILLEAFILQGKAGEHIFPVLKWWRRTKAYSLLHFTLSALHTAEAQLMLVELNVLTCTGGKRGLKGFGGSKGILQEGQFQVETEIFFLRICLSWIGNMYLEWKQITNLHIGTADIWYHPWDSMGHLFTSCERIVYTIVIHLELLFIFL